MAKLMAKCFVGYESCIGLYLNNSHMAMNLLTRALSDLFLLFDPNWNRGVPAALNEASPTRSLFSAMNYSGNEWHRILWGSWEPHKRNRVRMRMWLVSTLVPHLPQAAATASGVVVLLGAAGSGANMAFVGCSGGRIAPKTCAKH